MSQFNGNIVGDLHLHVIPLHHARVSLRKTQPLSWLFIKSPMGNIYGGETIGTTSLTADC